MTSSTYSIWETNLVTSLLVMTNQIVPPVKSLIQQGFATQRIACTINQFSLYTSTDGCLKSGLISGSVFYAIEPSHLRSLNTWKKKKLSVLPGIKHCTFITL